MKKSKGFTLIELMVVIAIIAILATVVLVSLQSARDSAEDSNRTSAISQFRSLAEVYYAQQLHYGALNEPTDELEELVYEYGWYEDFDNLDAGDVDAETEDDAPLRVNVEDEESPEEYCAAIRMRTDNEKWYCIDADLAIRELDNQTDNPCDGVTACPSP